MADRAISGEPYRLDKFIGGSISSIHADTKVARLVSGLVWTAPELRVQNITADPIMAGNGIISGTVKTAALPAALPVSRPVRLYREDTGVLVSITHSGIDGRYEFPGIPISMKFSVVSVDTSNVYGDVILGNRFPDAMP